MDKLKAFLFTNTTTKQTVAKNTFWLFLGEATGRILKVGLIIYAARSLGTGGWGIFSYALSTGSLLMILSEVGLSNLIMREAIQKNDGYKSFITTALFLKTVTLCISAILALIFAPLISTVSLANGLFPLIVTVLFFDSLRDLFFAINRVSEKMEREMIVKTIMNVVVLVVGIILIKHNVGPYAIAFAYAIGSALGALLIALYIRTDLRSIITAIDTTFFKPVITAVWPFVVINLIGTIIVNIDIYLLGLWKNSTEIGLYTSVQRIQQFILILPSMISTATFPLLSRVATDTERFDLITEKTISLLLLIGLPICIGGIFLAPGIIFILFGSAYSGAIPIMRILMITTVISFPFILLSNVIFAAHKQHILARAYGYGVLITVILNVLLIPRFGAIGSAVVSLVATFVMTLLVWRALGTVRLAPIFILIKGALLASMVMIVSIVLLTYIGISTIPTLIISSLLYTGVLIYMKDPILMEVKNILKSASSSVVH
jgi:O-antigen/teichoic acid export membrane protein